MPCKEFITKAWLLVNNGGYYAAVKDDIMRYTVVYDKVHKDAIAVGNILPFNQVYNLVKIEESTNAHMKVITQGEEKSNLHANSK